MCKRLKTLFLVILGAAGTLFAEDEDPEELFRTAEALSWKKNYAEADEVFQKLIEMDPQHVRARLQRARVLSWAGKSEESFIAYNSLEGIPPDAQNLIFLEGQAKRYVSFRALMAAYCCYQDLLKEDPCNTEALFDLGQVYCRLGFPCCAQEMYREVLGLIPDHDAAKKVLFASEQGCEPTAEASYIFWSEQGRDELKDVRRHRGLLSATYPICCGRDKLKLEVYYSTYDLDTVDEQSVTSAGIYWEGAWDLRTRLYAWLYVHQFGHAIDYTATGGVKGRFFWGDATTLIVGLEREDVLDNRFNFEEHVASHTLWWEWSRPFGCDWDALARLSQRWFDDGNWGFLEEASVGYQICRSPTLLRVAAQLFAYHVDEPTELFYSGVTLDQVHHPYWCPDNHLQGGLTLQWQHHPCEDYFCELDPFYYDLQAQVAYDRNDTISYAVRGEMQWNEPGGWKVKLIGYYLTSQPYKAAQGLLTVGRQF